MMLVDGIGCGGHKTSQESQGESNLRVEEEETTAEVEMGQDSQSTSSKEENPERLPT